MIRIGGKMEQLKDLYSGTFLNELAKNVKRYDNNFDIKKFLTDCLQPDWIELKLMERSDRVTVSLHNQFPDEFSQAAKLLKKVGPTINGLVAVCLPNYVAKYGLNDWQDSMDLLAELTRYSTGEFAIRPFLIKYPNQTSQQMLKWSQSDDIDIRRLSSEGMRPRLPWGIRLKQYMDDPSAVMPILENLIFDKSDYVQKSVANNLNDISKDNPQIVIAFAQKYWHQQASSDWVINHGLRTLFKTGRPEVLELLGYDIEANKKVGKLSFTPAINRAKIGESTQLQYSFTSKYKKPLQIYLGYRVHYIRQNKTDSYKDFFVKKTLLKPGTTVQGEINLKWKQLTTRRLYAGKHSIELLINTQTVKTIMVELSE